ncbi:MAG TPA: histidine phosphatase family protein [Actinomycetota bacterium]|nr:histidine phosphatase family protein [Actinomycetota bacterium]
MAGERRLWLVRHGDTEWSISRQHTGVTDLALVGEGERQAAAVGGLLAGRAFARVLSSPLRRARDTARLAGYPDAELTGLLREVDYGEYEGLTTAEIRGRDPGWDLFADGCPGGESPEEISTRADRLLALVGEVDGDVLLFGHGHCLRAMTARYLGFPITLGSQLRAEAGSLSILGHDHRAPAILLWGERPTGLPA